MYYRYVFVCCVRRSSAHCTQPAGDRQAHTHISSLSRTCLKGQIWRCARLCPPTADPSASSPLNPDQLYPARTTGPPEPGYEYRDMKTAPPSTQRGQAPSSPTPGTWYQDPRRTPPVQSDHKLAGLTASWSLSPPAAGICPQAQKGFLEGQWALCRMFFHPCSRWERCGTASGQDPKACPRIAGGKMSAFHPWSGCTGKCLSENYKSDLFHLSSTVKASFKCLCYNLLWL